MTTRLSSERDKYKDKDAQGILEGISSLHSWIKTHTDVQPTPKMISMRHEMDGVSLLI